eukprot:CAMPEP_0113879230 /NCGR_PEP_ID=MMETSP0780_2-20120614/7126_1 /TAXON_ID=652834 /ORGANISM="Palpitomonas bilix" /LENGTH=69 /DNA_ID=CAMNT_0000865795 /DNA_START=46 /DNA_END=255 /DNA_ORIENTATION=+ /assembly_acc=CAM_ASM_000599
MSTSGYDEGLSTLGAIAQDYGVNLSSAEEAQIEAHESELQSYFESYEATHGSSSITAEIQAIISKVDGQ